MGEWLTLNNRSVAFSRDFQALADRELVLVFVSTPFDGARLDDGNVVFALADSARANPRAEHSVLSTLPLGAMQALRKHFPELHLSYSPPMIKKHRFLSTFTSPPSGWQLFTEGASPQLRGLYASMQPGVRQIVAPDDVVEAAKMCTNMMLATKVIMANAIGAWLGEKVAAAVCEIVGTDPRLGDGYFAPGGPAAGPCLPRDMLELEAVSEGSLRDVLKALNVANGTRRLV